VVIEKDKDRRFITLARELAVPVLLRDMTEDQALIDAGVADARVIIIAPTTTWPIWKWPSMRGE